MTDNRDDIPQPDPLACCHSRLPISHGHLLSVFVLRVIVSAEDTRSPGGPSRTDGGTQERRISRAKHPEPRLCLGGLLPSVYSFHFETPACSSADPPSSISLTLFYQSLIRDNWKNICCFIYRQCQRWRFIRAGEASFRCARFGKSKIRIVTVVVVVVTFSLLWFKPS